MTYHPWRELRRLAHVTLRWRDTDAYLGKVDFCAKEITVATGMTQAERRCTVLHEIIHLERGPCLPGDEAREEESVEREVARRLVDIRKLGEALAWSRDSAVVADELWVDEPTLAARMRGLHPSERAYLRQRLAFLSVPDESVEL